MSWLAVGVVAVALGGCRHSDRTPAASAFPHSAGASPVAAYLLKPDPNPCVPTRHNGLADGGFEDVCASDRSPATGWQLVTRPGARATVGLAQSPLHGTRSLGLSNEVNGGEAGLRTSVAGLAPGERYALRFAQDSTTFVYAYLTFDGAPAAAAAEGRMMSVPASFGEWSDYVDYFTVPPGITNVTLTIATSGKGTMLLDDVRIDQEPTPRPAEFGAPLVSITFDDGDASAVSNAVPSLDRYGDKATFYVNAGVLGSPGRMTRSQVGALARSGNEIGSHLYHHSDIVGLDTPTLRNELMGNIAALRRILGKSYQVTDFASPYGSYTSRKLDTVMALHHSHRTTDGELNTKANLDLRQIHASLVTPQTTLADLQAWLDDAKRSHGWLVLVYHDIGATATSATGGEAGYTVTTSAFSAQLAAIAHSGVRVATVSAALTQLEAQF